MDHFKPPCRAFLEDFSAFVDGELPSGRRAEVQAHVDCCQSCLDHLTAYRRGITVLRSIEAEEPFDFWTRLEQRLWLGEELRVVDGAAGERESSRRRTWPTPAVSLAAAAVLALFVIVRGLGPGSTRMEVGPERVQASVAITLPEVPRSIGARAERRASQYASAAGTRSSVARQRPSTLASADPMESALARAESRATASFEQEIRGLQERVFSESLGRSPAESSLVSDGWIQPVRLGTDWSRPTIMRASLSRPVTPAPWNVDRAVSLP